MPPESQPSSPLHLLARQHKLKDSRYYELLVHIFVVILLISNLVAPKICQLGPFKVSGALLLFPITYIFGDIFTEVYGYAGSRRAIWVGFFGAAWRVLRRVPSTDEEARALVLGSIAAIAAFLVAGLFEYNFGDTEVLLVALTLMTVPFVIERDLDA